MAVMVWDQQFVLRIVSIVLCVLGSPLLLFGALGFFALATYWASGSEINEVGYTHPLLLAPYIPAAIVWVGWLLTAIRPRRTSISSLFAVFTLGLFVVLLAGLFWLFVQPLLLSSNGNHNSFFIVPEFTSTIYFVGLVLLGVYHAILVLKFSRNLVPSV